MYLIPSVMEFSTGLTIGFLIGVASYWFLNNGGKRG